MDYKEAGVDIEKANKTVNSMKKCIESTYNNSVISGPGFGGMFELGQYNNPVLVSSIDGVGTKLKVAFALNQYVTVGQDLVNHCVNDILVQGAKPLFFLDYFGMSQLDPDVALEVVKGFSVACKENGCVLIGGETAEMPGIYKQGEFDIAGCVVGVVEKDKIINGSNIKKGDKIIGLRSNGLHTNGYSLARKILTDYSEKFGAKTIGDELLKIHKSYLPEVSKILNKIKGMAHITGGGFENIERIIPEGLSVQLAKNWEIPTIFKLIQERGKVSEDEMYKTFNMGIGFVLIVEQIDVENIVKKVDGIVIGEVD